MQCLLTYKLEKRLVAGVSKPAAEAAPATDWVHLHAL